MYKAPAFSYLLLTSRPNLAQGENTVVTWHYTMEEALEAIVRDLDEDGTPVPAGLKGWLALSANLERVIFGTGPFHPVSFTLTDVGPSDGEDYPVLSLYIQ